MSIKRLAELTGLNRTYLADIERGAPNLTVATLLQIVQALNTSIAELFRGLEDTAINKDWDDKKVNLPKGRVKTGIKAKVIKRRRENSPQNRTQ